MTPRHAGCRARLARSLVGHGTVYTDLHSCMTLARAAARRGRV